MPLTRFFSSQIYFFKALHHDIGWSQSYDFWIYNNKKASAFLKKVEETIFVFKTL
jgi:hypothetical protein